MKGALLLLVSSACASASSEKPARIEVAIAPASTTASTPPAPVVVLDAASMNAEPPPNNNDSDENALVIRMTPPPALHGIPVVHADDDTTMVGLPRAVIRRVIRQNVAPIRACYEKGLATKTDLAGRVVVRFKIDPAGNVSKAESTSGTTLASADVVACVVGAFKSLVFPEPQGGAIIVDYPVVLAP